MLTHLITFEIIKSSSLIGKILGLEFSKTGIALVLWTTYRECFRNYLCMYLPLLECTNDAQESLKLEIYRL